MKNETKTSHTSGPWKLENSGELVIGNQVMGFVGPDTASREELKANAALIAAAPDLLAALEKAVNIVQSYNRLTGKGSDICAEMCAAIAKGK